MDLRDDDVVRPMPPRRPERSGAGSTYRRWRNRILIIGIPTILVVMSFLRFWVDLLWFEEVGQRDVLLTRIQWGSAIGIGFGLMTFLVLYGNLVIARRIARDDLYVPFLAVGVDPEAPEQPVLPHFVLKPILLGVAVVAGVISGLAMGGRWEVVLRFVGRSDFGVTDPHFGHDASFYVFTMPLLDLVVRSLQVLTVITAIGVAVTYVATGVIRYTPVPRVARPAIVHLSWLAAVFLVLGAMQFRLSIWHLATSAAGYVTGAGWTDTHVRTYTYWLMIIASIVLAVVVVINARRERWRIVGSTVVAWFAASAVLTGIIPALAQNVLVEPNELERETKLITGNIANTRAAFDLGKIEETRFRDEASLTERQLLVDNAGTTDNLRLWSPLQLQKVVQQEQALRRYYTFNEPDVDRYDVDGDYRQMMVSVRELDPTTNAVGASWTNERLAFTHGYGAVATLPNEVTKQGRPRYLLQDLPPRSTDSAKSLALTRPEVYFGEEGNSFVVVATRQREISGARGAGDGAGSSSSTYEGTGGINISGPGRRIAFATVFGDPRILFSGQFTSRSRLMMRRTIGERVRELAPFLELDSDPYAVVIDGRIKWVLDTYTTSDRFPYSEAVTFGRPQDVTGISPRVNYMRNSVKAVVDAYDGDVTLYAMDSKDPILGAWRSIFPDLFVDGSKMPRELRSHLRYPEDLFAVQTELWLRYHMSDVADFYSREDMWAVPTIDDQPMDAYYVLAKLPGAKAEELLLIRPLTPATRKNMISYMVARSDGDAYGEVHTLRLSAQELTIGPSQVQALIKQDSEISEQVRNWTTANNVVRFGDLLVLPIDKSLLYAQPVYLENQEAQIPEFQRLVLVLGDTIAWGEDFESAARSLLDKRAAELGVDAARSGSGTVQQGRTGAVPQPRPGDFSGLSQQELVQALGEIARAYDAAAACQKQADTVCFAREVERVEQILQDARKR